MAAGLRPFRNSIVRISSLEGRFAGLGYRLNEDLILTCAHVAAEALGADPEAKDPPEGTLYVEHPFRKSRPVQAVGPAEAFVDSRGWFRKGAGAGPADLALLRLRVAVPPPGPFAELTGALSLAGSRFVAYGGIAGHQENLAPIHGVVRDPIGSGHWQLGTNTEYTIEPGCSGGPVADAETGETLGLVAQDERDPSIPAGFLIPARQIRQALERAGVEIHLSHRGLPKVRAWAKKAIPSPAYDEQRSVLRFIDYYAGRPSRPMPFAGRADEFARLDAWWAGEGGSFLVVSGPAGMGKSALLLHWLAEVLDTREATGVLVLPISIRFGTSDELSGLRLLHAQLVGLFAELRFLPEATPDTTDYRAKIQEGWRFIGNSPADRYLLVVDGADEAAGPWLHEGVLPYEMPENLSIALSARHKPGHEDGRAWLEDFTFSPSIPIAEPLELERLARDAVGEAITQLGHPIDELADREGGLDELYRLTDQGDPLLVSLWAGQLWEERGRVRHLSVEDLAALEPSFGGFLDQWMEEQRRLWRSDGIDVHWDDIARLLGVLGVAHGPMRLADLLEVEGRLEASAPWDYKSARRVLDGADRLIVGNSEHTGYTFVHPRLADEFRRRAETAGAGHTSIHRAFAEWGAEVVAGLNTGEIEAEACPPYLLRNYTTHVLEVGLSKDKILEIHLLPLLEGGWHQAWYTEDGAYSGFLADLHQVENAVRNINLTSGLPVALLGEEIRCTLIRSSISSLWIQLPSELLVSLIRSSMWTLDRGLTIASNLDAAARSGIVRGLAAQPPGRLTGQEISTLLDFTGTIKDDGQRIDAMGALAPLLEVQDRNRLVDSHLDLADETADESLRAWVLLGFNREIRKRPDFLSRGMRIAELIKRPLPRAEALAALAEVLQGPARRRLLVKAIRIVETVSSGAEAAFLLQRMITPMSDDPELLERSLRIAKGIERESTRARALLTVARHLGRSSDLLAEATQACEAIESPVMRAQAFAALAASADGDVRRQLLGSALEAADNIAVESKGSKALTAIAEVLRDEESDLVERTLTALRRIEEPSSCVEGLVTIARCLPKARRTEVLGEALLIAQREPSPGACARSFTQVAWQLGGHRRSEVLARAVEAMEEEPDTFDRYHTAEIMAELLEDYPELLMRALRAVQGIWDRSLRVGAFIDLADELDGEARLEALERAQELAPMLEKESKSVEALLDLAAEKAGEERVALLDRALSVARACKGDGAGYTALLDVASELEGWARQEVLNEALEVAAKAPFLRGDALATVAKYFRQEDPLLGRALRVAQRIDHPWFRAEAVVAFAEVSSADERRRILDELLRSSQRIRDESNRAYTFSAVARALGDLPDLLPCAVEILDTIREPYLLVKALTSMALSSKGEARRELLMRALDVAEKVHGRKQEREPDQADALRIVVAALGGERDLASWALEAAEGIEEEDRRALVLAGLAPNLAGHVDLLTHVITLAERIQDVEARENALAPLPDLLHGEEALLEKAFAVCTRSLAETPSPSAVWCAVELAAEMQASYTVIQQCLKPMGTLHRSHCMGMLGVLAPVIRITGGEEAVRKTVDAISDTADYWP